MPTKDELYDENLALKAKVAELENAALVENDTTEAEAEADRFAVWAGGLSLVANSIYDEAGENTGEVEVLLCTADGLPADGQVVNGVYVDGVENKQFYDTNGDVLEEGDLYEFKLLGGAPSFKLQENVVAEGGVNKISVGEGDETYIYRGGEGFTRVADGTVIALEPWKVLVGDGTVSDPQIDKVYRVVGPNALREVAAGDESELQRRVAELEHDKLGLTTRLDEERDTVAALNRRLAAPLHGGIDDLPSVV